LRAPFSSDASISPSKGDALVRIEAERDRSVSLNVEAALDPDILETLLNVSTPGEEEFNESLVYKEGIG
jgi:hypothetical protein